MSIQFEGRQRHEARVHASAQRRQYTQRQIVGDQPLGVAHGGPGQPEEAYAGDRHHERQDGVGMEGRTADQVAGRRQQAEPCEHHGGGQRRGGSEQAGMPREQAEGGPHRLPALACGLGTRPTRRA